MLAIVISDELPALKPGKRHGWYVYHHYYMRSKISIYVNTTDHHLNILKSNLTKVLGNLVNKMIVSRFEICPGDWCDNGK